MNLAPEERVKMSLEDLIKSKQQAKKAAAKKGPKENKASKAPGQQQPGKNAAKSIGKGKAKRAAAADQRRGLNETGKATNKQVKAAVVNQQKKNVQKNIKTAAVKAKAKANAAKGNGGVAQPIGKGLKISFKPSELNKTTERIVASQILGALSKDPNFRKGSNGQQSRPNSGGDNSGRRIQVNVTKPVKPVKKTIVVRR